MSREQRPNPRLDEDLRFDAAPGGPPLYRPDTDKPVQYLTVVDSEGGIVGYAFANDEDDAGGFLYRKAGGPAAYRKSTEWSRRLREAKANGLRPTEALRELIAYGGDDLSHVRTDGPQESATLAALKERAGHS
ncbi:hypothetical protein ACIBI4_25675 [Streptomyces sp. NPDC050418]|uniref:hypothetical protein n=1 Tax=Streptomyces sp. NPDC050418 TaxID=3365612 RepID=UPI003787A47A